MIIYFWNAFLFSREIHRYNCNLNSIIDKPTYRINPYTLYKFAEESHICNKRHGQCPQSIHYIHIRTKWNLTYGAMKIFVIDFFLRWGRCSFIKSNYPLWICWALRKQHPCFYCRRLIDLAYTKYTYMYIVCIWGFPYRMKASFPELKNYSIWFDNRQCHYYKFEKF